MSLAKRLFSIDNVSKQSAHPKDPVIADWWGNSGLSSAGANVTPDTAMQVMAVYAAVRIIAESIAMLPLHLYRKKKQNGRMISSLANDLPLYDVLHNRPNKWQTPFEWVEMITGHTVLRGNGYSEIVSAPAKAVAQLIPLHPDRVVPFKAPDGKMAYQYTAIGKEPRILLQHEMFHLRGLSSDGLKGIDPITLAREALGISLAAETFGATFFGNGTVIGGVLEHPGGLGDKAYARLKKSWNERHQGSSQAHKPAILEEGMKWHTIGVEPEKAQFLETRKFQVTEIARMFRIPPHMIGDLEKATFSNITEMGQEFLTYTLMPWLIRWRQAIKRDLMSAQMSKTIEPKFKVASLLRGDTKTRFEAYQMAAGGNAPWMNRNEIRELEDMNPEDGLDELLTPLNMSKNSDSQGNDVDNHLNAMVKVTAIRLSRKEQKVIERNYDRHGNDLAVFFKNIDEFHAKFIKEIANQLVISEQKAEKYTASSKQILLETKDVDIKNLFNEWETTRAKELINLVEVELNELVHDTE